MAYLYGELSKVSESESCGMRERVVSFYVSLDSARSSTYIIVRRVVKVTTRAEFNYCLYGMSYTRV